MLRTLTGCTLLAAASLAQVPTPSLPTSSVTGTPTFAGAGGGWPFDHVLHDVDTDGRRWALGRDWKASFGADGIAFHPRVGANGRSLPLRLRLTSVRVAGEALALADAVPRRLGERIVYERGAVREAYALTAAAVEQTFEIVAARPGDVEVELQVTTDLHEDAATPRLQFVGEHGGVAYGEAFVVRDDGKHAIPTTWDGRSLRLRVPAELRGEGPVVIDPVLSTMPGAPESTLAEPDVAYDATNRRYLLVWESVFDEFDHDVLTLAFDDDGMPIGGSGAPVDATTTFVTHPRVANLDAADRFLVVTSMQDTQHQNRMMVFGRMRDASGTMAMHAPVRFSDPTLPGENFLPDVGADAGTGPGNHDWLAVWCTSLSGTVAHVYGRRVRDDGQPRDPNVMPIQTGNGHNWNVSMSRGNGNGQVPHPRWLVCYTRNSGPNNGDIFLRAVTSDGSVHAEQGVDTTLENDRFPHVSSPADHGNGETSYLVVYERALATRAVWSRVGASGIVSQLLDLTAQFGAGRYSPRVDSDGKRFVVSSSMVNPFSSQPDFTRLITMAWNGYLPVRHDIATIPGVVREPQVASLRANGGPGSDHAIAYLELVNGFLRPMLARYSGRTAGPTTSVMATACDGLAIASDGSSALGNVLTFTLANFGVDLPGFAFGGAAANAVPICPTCSLGLRLDLPILPTFGTAGYTVAIPLELGLIGAQFAVQGLSLGGGSCLGGLRFSDTVQFTVR